MADNRNFHDKDEGWDGFKEWIPTLIMLFFIFPVGLIMLLVKLFGLSDRHRGASQHPYDRAQAAGWQASRDEAGRQGAEAGRQAAQEAAAAGRQAAREAKEAARAATEDARNAGRRAAQEAKDEVRRAMEETRDAVRTTVDAFKTAPTPQREKKAKKTPPPKRKKPEKWEKMLRSQIDSARALAVGGGCTAGIGLLFTLMMGMEREMEGALVFMAVLGGGLLMLYYGVDRGKKAKRYRKYLALIGKRSSIAVDTLAQAMGVSVRRACGDLQAMLDAGLFPMGFLDMGSGRLILSDEGLQDLAEEPTPQAEPAPAAPKGMEREDQVLREIREVNDAIPDVVMSGKIDRIEEITGKIFAYLREKPDKEGQLRSFLSYYLPTTLKILRAYAQMDAQGIEGENITAAKARIEGMMDKVVDGFEKQLDKLFQDDAMDITTDVAVLERMLDKDGLGGGGLQLGG